MTLESDLNELKVYKKIENITLLGHKSIPKVVFFK